MTGEGRVTAPPDVALLSLGVSVLRDSATAAQDAAARSMGAVLDSLHANGVEEADVTTTQFSLRPEFDFRGEGERVLRGFRVTNTVSAKIRDLDRASRTIDDAIGAAGDDVVVNNISFTIDDPAPLRDEARTLAAADARRKADALAESAGVDLGAVLSLSESGAAPPRPLQEFERAVPAAALAGAPTPISEGEVVVSVSVFVTYSLD